MENGDLGESNRYFASTLSTRYKRARVLCRHKMIVLFGRSEHLQHIAESVNQMAVNTHLHWRQSPKGCPKDLENGHLRKGTRDSGSHTDARATKSFRTKRYLSTHINYWGSLKLEKALKLRYIDH